MKADESAPGAQTFGDKTKQQHPGKACCEIGLPRPIRIGVVRPAEHIGTKEWCEADEQAVAGAAEEKGGQEDESMAL